ncbi:retrovirus-related pol polyprotein from transposon TNT 1-94 [Tanacetum coccineum]
MSFMGELTFFLGLQVQQKKDGIFISQDKYMAKILKKFDFDTVKIASTPMEPNKALVKDEEADSVDVHLYRSMIGSLMYLTASRPNIMFVVVLVKRMISWAIKKQNFVANSTTEAEYVAAANCYGQQPKKTHKPRKAIRTTEISQSSRPINLVADETVYKEWEDKMEKAATTASSLDAEQDSGNINRTQSMVTLNESFPQGTDSGSGPSTLEDGEVEMIATIDGQLKTITEASLRRHLKLEDADGISSLPNTEIFEQLALMGYASDSDKLTFQKGRFSPQWRFLIHTILYCLSPKKTAWEQFSSNIATAIICLATNRTFNFSKMIFEGMQGEGSTVPVESHHTPITTLSTSQPPLLSPSRVPTPPYDLPLPGGHTPGSDEGRMQQTELMDLVIKLSDKVLALETDLQQTK